MSDGWSDFKVDGEYFTKRIKLCLLKGGGDVKKWINELRRLMVTTR